MTDEISFYELDACSLWRSLLRLAKYPLLHNIYNRLNHKCDGTQALLKKGPKTVIFDYKIIYLNISWWKWMLPEYKY